VEVVVGGLLTFAVVVAVSPVPVVAVVLLLADRAADTGVGFLLGWVVGIAGAMSGALLLVGGTADPGAGTRSVLSWTALVLGVALLVLGVQQWRSRPGPGEVPALPRWVGAVDRCTAPRAGGTGAAALGGQPEEPARVPRRRRDDRRRRPLPRAGGVGRRRLHRGRDEHRGGPGAHARRPRRPGGRLEQLRRWLTAHGARATAALLLAIGAVLVGQGLSGIG
jgi:hypothetical protein